ISGKQTIDLVYGFDQVTFFVVGHEGQQTILEQFAVLQKEERNEEDREQANAKIARGVDKRIEKVGNETKVQSLNHTSLNVRFRDKIIDTSTGGSKIVQHLKVKCIDVPLERLDVQKGKIFALFGDQRNEKCQDAQKNGEHKDHGGHHGQGIGKLQFPPQKQHNGPAQQRYHHGNGQISKYGPYLVEKITQKNNARQDKDGPQYSVGYCFGVHRSTFKGIFHNIGTHLQCF